MSENQTTVEIIQVTVFKEKNRDLSFLTRNDESAKVSVYVTNAGEV
jgi:hypothetical protein